MLLPKSNTWALIGAGITTVVVFVLNFLLQFFASGKSWPTTVDGWVTLLLPAVCAGVLAALTPYYKHESSSPSDDVKVTSTPVSSLIPPQP